MSFIYRYSFLSYLLSILIIGFLIISPSVISAGDPIEGFTTNQGLDSATGVMIEFNKGTDKGDQNTLGLKDANLVHVIGKAISTILGLLGVLVLGLFLYSGFIWLTAMDKSEKKEEAIKTMKNTMIGLLIIVLSYALSTFLFDLFLNLSTTTT